MTNFKELNLNPTIISTLEQKGYLVPTPIQSQAIPHLLLGKDLLGIAQTGTGKTAAFALPMINRLSESHQGAKSKLIRALILTPTRELATQVSKSIETYGKGLGLKHAVIFGGVSSVNQIKTLRNGVDIVVATPGRLLDLMNQGYVRLSQIEIFVLDEADRMLDMGFINDVKKIISKLPQKRQSLLFSATMPEAISSLAHSLLDQPVKVEITPESTTVDRINQKVYLVAKANKLELLLDVVTKPDVVAALVFSKTKHGANKVVMYLEKYGVLVSAIHGNKSQAAREKALEGLRSGKIKVLVATDIAARGIDVPSISHVINYDIPLDPESYVHRIGRTARAGREGMAISFCDPSEFYQLRAVEKAIRMKIPVDDSHPFHGKVPTNENKAPRTEDEGNKFSHRTKDNRRDGKRKFRDNNSNSSFDDREKYQENGRRNYRDNKRRNRDDNERSSEFGEKRRYGNHQKRDLDNRGGSGQYSENDRRDSRSRSRFDNSSRTRPFSKEGRFKEGRPARNKPWQARENQSDNFRSEGDESTTKKILRKFGFGKFGKKADFSESNKVNSDSFRSGPRSKGKGRFGNNNRFSKRSDSFESNTADSDFSSSRRPRNKNFGKKFGHKQNSSRPFFSSNNSKNNRTTR